MASNARARLASRLRRGAISWFRASRLFPRSSVNRVPDVDFLGVPLTTPVIVYFATAQDTIYQLSPWLAALQALDEEMGVTVVLRDSRTARLIRRQTSLECVTVGTPADLDGILADSGVKLALYVNLDPLDFDCLSQASILHAYIGHGDSGKSVFASNQIKAFDRYLVAGEAARRRIARRLMMYDASTRCMLVGQPQLDNFSPSPPALGARTVVAYAPTWEGAQPSNQYSSLVSHGPAIVESLVVDGRFDLVYRPHPLTGLEDATFAAADLELRRRVTAAGHRVNASGSLEDALNGVSVVITDTSAVTSFWVTTGRPLLVTTLPGPATRDQEELSSALPSLSVAAASQTAQRVNDLLVNPPDLAEIARFHLGDTSAGSATRTFLAACRALVTRRDDLLPPIV